MSTPSSSNPSPALPPQVNGLDPAFLDAQYRQWQKDPNSVGADWRTFFQGFELGYERAPEPAKMDGSASATTAPAPIATTAAAAPAAPAASRGSQSKVDSLIYAYRNLGHLAANLDPLGTDRPFPEQLTLESFGLTDGDLASSFDPGSLPLPLSVRAAVQSLG